MRCVTPRRILAAGLLACTAAGCGTAAHQAQRPTTTTPPAVRPAARLHAHPVRWRLAARVSGRLPAPLQDPASAAADGGGVLLLGGLTAADTSTASILRATGEGAEPRGSLPAAVHDAAAATVAGHTYLFGGGNGVAQLDGIVRVPASQAGRLPAASSDQASATIGETAYVVGGYTGTRWLDT